MGDLTNLAYIDLSSNSLSGAIPSQLGSIASLETLRLNLNGLSGAIPPELGNLSALTGLYLDDNALTGSIPTELGNLHALVTLSLAFNELSGSIPPWKREDPQNDMPLLQVLSLTGNHLTGSIPAELGTLVTLTDLELDDNRLEGAIPSSLGSLTELATLFLNGNKLTGEIPGELSALVNLEVAGLDLRWNALHSADGPLITFLNSKQFDNVDFRDTQTLAPAGVTAGTPTAESVPLSWTPITYTGDTGGYQVYYGTVQGGPYALFGTTADKTESSLTVTGLAPETPYYFVVDTVTDDHAHNQNDVVSEQSVEVPATTLCTPPEAPVLSSATPTCGGVDLTWAAGLGTNNAFRVYRAASCGGSSTLIYGPDSGTSFSDTDLVEGVSHTYWVLGACDAGGLSLSPESNCLTAARLVAPVPTISGETSNACPSASVTLATESGMSDYQWYRGGIAIGGANSDTYQVTTMGSYDYTVSYRLTSEGCPGLSENHGVTISLCPPGETAPGTSPSTAQSWSGKTALGWPINPMADTYTLYRGLKGDLADLLTGDPDACTRYQDSSASATDLSEDPSAMPGRFYWYLVTATNAAGEGPAGNATAGQRVVNPTGECDL
jgi:hypothetical protein